MPLLTVRLLHLGTFQHVPSLGAGFFTLGLGNLTCATVHTVQAKSCRLRARMSKVSKRCHCEESTYDRKRGGVSTRPSQKLDVRSHAKHISPIHRCPDNTSFGAKLKYNHTTEPLHCTAANTKRRSRSKEGLANCRANAPFLGVMAQDA